MMSIFEPGSEPLPWLGKISHLGPISGKFWLPDVFVHFLGEYLKECLSYLFLSLTQEVDNLHIL